LGRLEKRFNELRKRKEKALILFMTAGDPSLALNEKLIPAFEAEGVDAIEIGVPFSDPVADGPAIQASSQRALSKGISLDRILAMVSRVRRHSNVPILLMGYLNPFLSLGLERFAARAQKAGVDGLIIPDLPVDEGVPIARLFRKYRLDLVFLAAPTTPPARRRHIARASKGFLYFVSVTGVTGSKTPASQLIAEPIRSLKKLSSLPVCVGFGVSTPEKAAEMARISDGVIVGSALVRALEKRTHADAAGFARQFVRPFKKALKKGESCRKQ